MTRAAVKISYIDLFLFDIPKKTKKAHLNYSVCRTKQDEYVGNYYTFSLRKKLYVYESFRIEKKNLSIKEIKNHWNL